MKEATTIGTIEKLRITKLQRTKLELSRSKLCVMEETASPTNFTACLGALIPSTGANIF